MQYKTLLYSDTRHTNRHLEDLVAFIFELYFVQYHARARKTLMIFLDQKTGENFTSVPYTVCTSFHTYFFENTIFNYNYGQYFFHFWRKFSSVDVFLCSSLESILTNVKRQFLKIENSPLNNQADVQTSHESVQDNDILQVIPRLLSFYSKK